MLHCYVYSTINKSMSMSIVRFVPDLLRNPEDRFCCDAAHIDRVKTCFDVTAQLICALFFT